MNVILAKSAGFCFGVKRAVEMAYSQAGNENVYTFGPIIHNEEVVKDLEEKGVRVIESEEDIENGYNWYKEDGEKLQALTKKAFTELGEVFWSLWD